MKLRAMLCPCLLLAACSPGKDLASGRSAVAQIHAEYSRGGYASIWEAGAPQLKASIDRSRFVRLLTAFHDRLGGVKADKPAGWRETVGTTGKLLTLIYDTTFETGAGRETFVFRPGRGGMALSGYNLNSDALFFGPTAPTGAGRIALPPPPSKPVAT